MSQSRKSKPVEADGKPREPRWFRVLDGVLSVLFIVAVSGWVGLMNSDRQTTLSGPVAVWLLVLVVVGVLALGFWRYQWRVRIRDQRKQRLNEAKKTRLEGGCERAADVASRGGGPRPPSAPRL